MYLVTIIKKKIKFIDLGLLTNLFTEVAPRCLGFWTKWSWGICVIPIWWITHNVYKLTHITYLVLYLVTIIKKEKIKFVDFCLLVNLFTEVAPRCLDFCTKRSWGICVIPLWWIAYNMNKLTHTNLSGNVFGYNHKKIKFIDFCLLTNLCTHVAPRCLGFWTKWSWGICVIPIWWITHNVYKLTHITYLVLYLVTIIKKKIKFVDFCLLTNLYTQVAPRCLDFWTN